MLGNLPLICKPPPSGCGTGWLKLIIQAAASTSSRRSRFRHGSIDRALIRGAETSAVARLSQIRPDLSLIRDASWFKVNLPGDLLARHQSNTMMPAPAARYRDSALPIHLISEASPD